MADGVGALDLARRWVDAYNGKDYDELREIFADDLVLVDMGLGLTLEGGETFVEGIQQVAEEAIPDRHVTALRFLADGDTAIIEASWEGTVQVEKWGLPPGSVRRHKSCTLLETENGKIKRMTDYTCAQEDESGPTEGDE